VRRFADIRPLLSRRSSRQLAGSEVLVFTTRRAMPRSIAVRRCRYTRETRPLMHTARNAGYPNFTASIMNSLRSQLLPLILQHGLCSSLSLSLQSSRVLEKERERERERGARSRDSLADERKARRHAGSRVSAKWRYEISLRIRDKRLMFRARIIPRFAIDSRSRSNGRFEPRFSRRLVRATL